MGAFIGVWHACHSVPVEVRGQLAGVGSLLSLSILGYELRTQIIRLGCRSFSQRRLFYFSTCAGPQRQQTIQYCVAPTALGRKAVSWNWRRET